MKVMHVVQHLNIGGLEKLVVSMLKKSSYSSQSFIVSLEGNAETLFKGWPELESYKDQLFFVDKPKKFSMSVVDQMVNFVDENEIDVIHSHHIGPILYSTLTCLKRKSLKHISTIHDAWYLNQFKYRTMTQVFNTLHPIYWVADAGVVADDFDRFTKIKPDQTILNGIDCVKFSEINQSRARYVLGLPKTKKILGCAARMEPGKGHKTLLREFAKLNSEWFLVLAGDGSLKNELMQLCRALDIEKRTVFLGNIEDMVSFYSAIDVFCLLSEKEGMPLTLLESMACNTPVIANNVGGIPEIVTDQNGHLFECGQIIDFSNVVERVLLLKDNKNIRDFVIQNAELSLMARSYDELYQKL
ncbi:Putative glycosyltransferase [Pseudoalteromonas luteoviolacea B = ATCC 29581]|nr:Putative glycosyltransferase [Pseudoalteromonas luteoviolacea B = ATCC 29581]